MVCCVYGVVCGVRGVMCGVYGVVYVVWCVVYVVWCMYTHSVGSKMALEMTSVLDKVQLGTRVKPAPT